MRMVVIGDSVLWGQGLLQRQKIGHRVHRRLTQEGWPVTYDPNRDFLAHSGAIIGEPDAEGEEAHPEIDALVAGEIPTDHPTIFQQLERIHAPHEVELLLMDGGANDFGFMNLAKPRNSLSDLEVEIKANLAAAGDAITAARGTCPNAIILYSGYYCGLSRETSTRALDAVITWGLMSSPLGLALGSLASLAWREVRKRVVRANHFWHHVQLLALRRAVAKAQADPELRGPGLAFVHPRFGVHNAAGADEPYVRSAMLRASLGPVGSVVPGGTSLDPVYSERREACNLHYSGEDQEVVEEQEAFMEEVEAGTREASWQEIMAIRARMPGRSGLFKCRRASSFHPLPAGAARYASAFAETFEDTVQVRLRDFASALAPETRSVRTAIRRWGLDGRRVDDDRRPSSLSLRELSQHQRIDSLTLTVESGRMTFPTPSLGEPAAVIAFELGTRTFRLDTLDQRHLQSSDGLVGEHTWARFVVDPSFAVEAGGGEGQPMPLRAIRHLALESPFAWEFKGLKVVLNGHIVVYDTTNNPDMGGRLDAANPRWRSGELGTPAYPAPEAA